MTTTNTAPIHPTSFAALLAAELDRFARLAPATARVFAAKNISKRIGITYTAAAAAIALLDAEDELLDLGVDLLTADEFVSDFARIDAELAEVLTR